MLESVLLGFTRTLGVSSLLGIQGFGAQANQSKCVGRKLKGGSNNDRC